MLEAVRSVPKHDAAELWIVGFRTLKDLSLPLDSLVQQLVHALSGSTKGPLQVGSLPMAKGQRGQRGIPGKQSVECNLTEHCAYRSLQASIS